MGKAHVTGCREHVLGQSVCVTHSGSSSFRSQVYEHSALKSIHSLFQTTLEYYQAVSGSITLVHQYPSHVDGSIQFRDGSLA